MTRRALALLGASCLLAGTIAVWPGCSDGGSGTPADASARDVVATDVADAIADVRSESAADAEVLPVWDPVWHLTAPATYQQLGPEGQPSCGTGCRIALNWPVHSGRPSLMHAYTETAVADYGDVGLFYAPVGSSVTSLIVPVEPAPDGGAADVAEPALAGDFAAYVVGRGLTDRIEVMRVSTGERKPAYEYSYGGPTSTGTFAVALNSAYVFWVRDGVGLMSRSLADGTIRTLVNGVFECTNMAAATGGVVCCDDNRGVVTWTDQETASVTPIDFGGGLQVDASISSDRRWYIWVDYRDPPGPASDLDNRFGGEIYMRDLQMAVTTRLTTDSPTAPRAKITPATDGTIAVWNEIPAGLDPNPTSATAVYDSATMLVVLDLATRKKCHVDLGIAHTINRFSVHGRHVYGYFGAAGDNKMHLVDLNIDDPGMTWTCQ